MTTRRRWAAALVAAAVGCASPVPRHGVADGAADAVVSDGGEEDRDARVADASGDAGDRSDAEDAAASVDASDAAEDADANEVAVDAGDDADAVADAVGAEVFEDVRDAAVEASVDAGPPTMRLTFVGGSLRGDAGAISMRAVIVWHGAIRGQSPDGRITFRGWFR